jgi:hypothetical protein
MVELSFHSPVTINIRLRIKLLQEVFYFILFYFFGGGEGRGKFVNNIQTIAVEEE